MSAYVGLDASFKETAVLVRRGGKRIWRGKCLSDPKALAISIRRHAPDAERVVFETDQLLTWFYHALKAMVFGPSVLMRVMRRQPRIWQRTRQTRSTRMVWHILRKSDPIERFGRKGSIAC